MEGGAAATSAGLDPVARGVNGSRRRRGAAAEPEQWTSSWTRIHETAPLDHGLLHRVAARLARYIVTLQPLLEADEPSTTAGD